MYVVFMLVGFAMGVVLCDGLNKVKAREARCTETVKAVVKNFKQHRLFGCKYYQLTLLYTYEEKECCIEKGYFNSKLPEAVLLHVNPDNPEEAYMTTIAEKCGCKA